MVEKNCRAARLLMKIDASPDSESARVGSAYVKQSFAGSLLNTGKIEKVPDFIDGNRPVNNS